MFARICIHAINDENLADENKIHKKYLAAEVDKDVKLFGRALLATVNDVEHVRRKDEGNSVALDGAKFLRVPKKLAKV